MRVSRPSTAFNLFASPAFFRTGAAKKAFGDPQGFITALGEKFTDLASVSKLAHWHVSQKLVFVLLSRQIQLLKPSTKAPKILDVTVGADDDDGAAAALASAAAAAADMSKELLGTLPLEEVKKRTILQQQVPACTLSTSHYPLHHPHPNPALTRTTRQRLKSLGASLKNDQIRSRRIVREHQLQVRPLLQLSIECCRPWRMWRETPLTLNRKPPGSGREAEQGAFRPFVEEGRR